MVNLIKKDNAISKMTAEIVVKEKSRLRLCSANKKSDNADQTNRRNKSC